MIKLMGIIRRKRISYSGNICVTEVLRAETHKLLEEIVNMGAWPQIRL
jgi:hypothetical protein